MRRMLFATFLIPGASHYIELVHPYDRFDRCGVTKILASLYAPNGRELATATLPLDDTVLDLGTVLPVGDDSAMVLTDVAYDLKGKRHPYEYGFLYQPGPDASPIHYPLDVALGLTDAITYLPNYGYFPFGPLPSWLGIRLFLGNVSEHAVIEPEVEMVTAKGARRVVVSLPPLSHRVLDLPEGSADDPLRYLTVRGTTKPVCYVAGLDRRTGTLTFLEHLMQTFKLNGERPAPAASDRRASGQVPATSQPVQDAALRGR